MSAQYFKDISCLLKQLESSSSAVVFKGLYDVRYKLMKTSDGVQLFKENNGLRYLFRFIRKPNEKILDISLSILANMCLEEEIKVQVAEENGMIAHILNLSTHVEKDSIVGRAFRLIGNLATSQPIALKLFLKGAVPKLVESVKSKNTSPATKHMAVRALRLIWEAETNKTKMLQDQVVQTVASLLTTDIDELLQAVLKALTTFTHRCNEQCALQVQGEGKGFEELVSSIQNCSKKELAVSVILNLCFVPEVRPLLGTAGVVEAIINLLNGLEPKQYSPDLISVLCLLCRESVNRSKVRRSGGLEVLLDTLRCEIHPNLEARALNALLHFIYDEVGLEILIKEGLVPVLVHKLVKVVDNNGNLHGCQTLKADSSVSSSFLINKHKRIRLDGSKEENISQSCVSDRDPLGLRTREVVAASGRFDTLLSGHWSPGSARSVEFSPDTTRTFSPLPYGVSCSPTSSGMSPSSQSPPPSPLSDAYSPVCGYSSSEDEKPDDTDAEGVIEVEVDSDHEVTSPCLKDKDDIEDIQEALNASLPSNVTSRHGLIESWCLLLLSRVSHMDSLVEDMVSSTTVDTLLQYYTLLEPPHPRAARVLQRMTRNHQCLVPLLRAGLVLKVNSRLTQRLHEDCSRCHDFDRLGNSLLSQMSMLAESGFGEGQIVHHLMRAPRNVKASLIISVPYIIRTKRLLRLMLNCKINDKSGLDLLLQLMTDEYGDGLSHEAIDSLSHLARQIGVPSQDPLKSVKVKRCERSSEYCSLYKLKLLDNRPSDDIVVLKLDNGASVKARKGDLCAESPMFAAMFSGSFCESGCQSVPLKDVSEDGLNALLSLMSSPSHCQCYLSNGNTDLAFEVLNLADRFILPKVVDKVSDWLISQLVPDVVPSFYLHSQKLRHILLVSEKISNESLHVALSVEIDKKKRYKMFSSILNSDFKQQFVEDVLLLIKFHAERPCGFF